MEKHPVLLNAPIIEALLDIRVEPSKNINLEKLESAFGFIKDRFPTKRQSLTYYTGLERSLSGDLTPIQPSKEVNGFHFTAQDGRKIAQFRLDGFTFNKLKPYKNWNEFRDEGEKLWNLYFEIAKPIKIIRIALRYINQIEIPLPVKDFEEYILTLPKLAPKLPQTVSNYFLRFTISNTNIEATAIITQTMKNPTSAEKLPIILDIDAFKLQTYSENKQQMWDEFEKLRIFKNDIFFDSLTNRTTELFK